MRGKLPPFSALCGRYEQSDIADQPVTVSLRSPPSTGEGAAILSYLRAFGHDAHSPAELLQAIDALTDEEELAAFRCHEGVAVSHASDGWWVLFTE